MMAMHCDRSGCDKMEKDGHGSTFVVVDLPGYECPHEGQRHFCSMDCLMFWAAQQDQQVP